MLRQRRTGLTSLAASCGYRVHLEKRQIKRSCPLPRLVAAGLLRFSRTSLVLAAAGWRGCSDSGRNLPVGRATPREGFVDVSLMVQSGQRKASIPLGRSPRISGEKGSWRSGRECGRLDGGFCLLPNYLVSTVNFPISTTHLNSPAGKFLSLVSSFNQQPPGSLSRPHLSLPTAGWIGRGCLACGGCLF